jgi:hypothetical protein
MRGERGPALLLAATVALALAAGAVLATAAPPPQRVADAEAFQSLVGGLGLGAAVDLSRCAPEFDPRVERACSLRFDPIPCGSSFCPAHAGD